MDVGLMVGEWMDGWMDGWMVDYTFQLLSGEIYRQVQLCSVFASAMGTDMCSCFVCNCCLVIVEG